VHSLQRLRVTGTAFLGPDDLAGLVASPHLTLLELRGLRLLNDAGLYQLLSREPSTAPPPPVPIGLHLASLPTPPAGADTAAAAATVNATGDAGDAAANVNGIETTQPQDPAVAAAADLPPVLSDVAAATAAENAPEDTASNMIDDSSTSSTDVNAVAGSTGSNASLSSSSSPLVAEVDDLSPLPTTTTLTAISTTPPPLVPPPLPLGLEELLLSDCTNLRNLKFPCAHLQRLELKHCVNLASFQMPSLPQLLDVDLQFCTGACRECKP